MYPKFNDTSPYTERQREDTDRDGHVKMEAEMNEMQPEANEYLEPSEPEETRKHAFL